MDTSGAVAPPDAEVVQVGDAIRQRAEWRGLAQGAVWPVRVVEVLVLAPKTRIRRVLQPHKPKIIPRPGSQRRGDEQPAVSGASGQMAQVFGTLKLVPCAHPYSIPTASTAAPPPP
jgi:hypothetical protein